MSETPQSTAAGGTFPKGIANTWKSVADEFPLAAGVPMHLLTERGLNEAFLQVVERHRREGLGVVVRREGRVTRLPVDELSPEISAARQRIAELDAQIAEYHRPFSLNEQPPAS